MSNGAPLSQGMNQGAAQVLSFPQVDRAIEFERQVKLEKMRNDNIERRQQAIERKKEFEANLARTDAKYWDNNPNLAKKIEAQQKETIDFIYNHAKEIAAGDINALKQMRHMTNKLQADAGRTLKYKEKHDAAAQLYIQDQSQWSEDAIKLVADIGRGDVDVEEVEAENPYWNIPDLGESPEKIWEDFTKNELSNYMGKDFDSPEDIGQGFLNVPGKYNVDDAFEAYKTMVTSDPTKAMRIVKHNFERVKKGEIQEGQEMETHLNEIRERLNSMNAPSELQRKPTYTPPRPDKDAVKPDDFARGREAAQTVEYAIESGDTKFLNDAVSSAGFRTQYDEKTDEWVFTNEVGLQDGKTKAGDIIRIPRENRQMIYEFIAAKNKNYKLEAMEAATDLETGVYEGTAIEQMKAAPDTAKDLVRKTKSDWANNDNAIKLIESEYDKLGFTVTIDDNNMVTGFFGAKPEIKSVTKGDKTYRMSKPEDVQALEKEVAKAIKQSVQPEERATNKANTNFKGVPQGGF